MLIFLTFRVVVLPRFVVLLVELFNMILELFKVNLGKVKVVRRTTILSAKPFLSEVDRLMTDQQ